MSVLKVYLFDLSLEDKINVLFVFLDLLKSLFLYDLESEDDVSHFGDEFLRELDVFIRTANLKDTDELFYHFFVNLLYLLMP